MKILTFKAKDFFDKLDIKNYDTECFSTEINNSLKKFVDKYKTIENIFTRNPVIVIVNNIAKANYNFNSKDILFIKNIDWVISLDLFIHKYDDLKAKNIDVGFIIDENFNKDFYLIEEYCPQYAKFNENEKRSHKLFENSIKNKPTIYVKNVRKSLINTIFGGNSRAVYRQNKSDEIRNINNIPNISHKYINIECPFCKEKFEINIDSIDEIITIENQNNRISFNCLHKKSPEIKTGKFYINPSKDYSLDMNEYSSKEIQLWFLFNFPQIVKIELEEESK